MIDKMIKGLDHGSDLGADFIDIRFQNKYTANYQSKDTELTSKTGSRRGFGVRAVVKGALGIASTTSMEYKDLQKAIKQAVILAKNSSDVVKDKISFAETKSYQENLVSPRVKPLQDISVEEKITMIKEAEKVFKEYEEIKSHTISYNEIIDHRLIMNNEGTQIELKDMKPTITVQAIAARENKIIPFHDSWCKTKGFELLDEHPLDQLSKFVAETAIKNLDATLPPGGPTSVVIDHPSVGIIAHEAVGHCSEADLVEGGSFLKGKLGKKVCSELVTIVDAPFLEDSSGWVPFDDEGTKGKSVEIIKEGKVNGYLNNRYYAAKMDMEPTGNARAFSFRHEPIVRMRNTYVAQGDMTDEELYEAIGDGLLVTGLMNGSADTSGEFMVGTGQAIEIKNGKLTDQVFIGPTMTGNAFEVLSSVVGVGKEFRLNLGQGFCGKGQPAKVDAGGSKLACTVILGGK
jgi:TldD protein